MGGGFPFPIPGMRGFPGMMGGMPGGMPGGMMFVNGQPVHMGGGMNPQEMFMRQNLNIKMTMEVNMVDLFAGIKKNVEYQYKNLETGEMKKDPSFSFPEPGLKLPTLGFQTELCRLLNIFL